MNKLIQLFDRAKAWLRTNGEESALDVVLLCGLSSLLRHPNDAFDQAVSLTHKKPLVLKSRRERLLCRLIIREVDRASVSRYLTVKERRKSTIFGSGPVFESFLNRGFLYFSDCGISAESQFQFLELGRISPELYRELKAVPGQLHNMLFVGEDRRQEFQRRVLDRLMNTFWQSRLKVG